MIFKRFYKVLLLQQEGNCPQTANVSYIHLLLAAISGRLKIHLGGRGLHRLKGLLVPSAGT